MLWDWSFGRSKYTSSKIFPSERRIKRYQLIGSQEHSGVRHPTRRQRWQTDWSREKYEDVILSLIKVQKPEFWNGLKRKQRSVIL
jgi:hypothetical protein